MRGKNLDDNNRHLGKLPAKIFSARLHASGSSINSSLRNEEHIVVADHKDDTPRFQPIHSAMVQTPKNVLRLVPTNTDIDNFGILEFLHPCDIHRFIVQRTTPLLRDTISYQQEIDCPLIGFDVLDKL